MTVSALMAKFILSATPFDPNFPRLQLRSVVHPDLVVRHVRLRFVIGLLVTRLPRPVGPVDCCRSSRDARWRPRATNPTRDCEITLFERQGFSGMSSRSVNVSDVGSGSVGSGSGNFKPATLLISSIPVLAVDLAGGLRFGFRSRDPAGGLVRSGWGNLNSATLLRSSVLLSACGRTCGLVSCGSASVRADSG